MASVKLPHQLLTALGDAQVNFEWIQAHWPSISSGSGAPTLPGGSNPMAGDYYLRTDTPAVANQRIYVCTAGGGTPTWVGIV